eukprot:gene32843-biopygen6886
MLRECHECHGIGRYCTECHGPSKDQAAKKQVVRNEEHEPKWPMGADSLIQACRKGDIEATLPMLRREADKEACDGKEKTHLHWATENGTKSCLSAFVEAGADTPASDNDERTFLSFAAVNGHFECLQVLLEAGADVSAEGDGGWTALLLAALAAAAARRRLCRGPLSAGETLFSSLHALSVSSAPTIPTSDNPSQLPANSPLSPIGIPGGSSMAVRLNLGQCAELGPFATHPRLLAIDNLLAFLLNNLFPWVSGYPPSSFTILAEYYAPFLLHGVLSPAPAVKNTSTIWAIIFPTTPSVDPFPLAQRDWTISGHSHKVKVTVVPATARSVLSPLSYPPPLPYPLLQTPMPHHTLLTTGPILPQTPLVAHPSAAWRRRDLNSPTPSPSRSTTRPPPRPTNPARLSLSSDAPSSNRRLPSPPLLSADEETVLQFFEKMAALGLDIEDVEDEDDSNLVGFYI